MYVSEDGITCCAVGEIVDLNDYEGKPEEAMKVFVNNFRCYGGAISGFSAFYVFTGVVRCSASKYDCGCKKHSYGKEFAAYIKKHRLGVLRESPGRVNRVNHPEHTVKVWVWAPSERRLIEWWKEYGGK